MSGEDMPMNIPETEDMYGTLEFGVNDLAALDVDRALIYSDHLSGIVYDTMRRAFPDDPEKLRQIEEVQQREVREMGNSFAYIEVLEQTLGMELDPIELAALICEANRDPETGKIRQELIAGNRDEGTGIMIEGALDYVRAVNQTGAQSILMTAGQEKTQLMKVALVNVIFEQEVGRRADGFVIVDEKSVFNKWAMLSGVYDSQTERFDIEKLRRFTSETAVDLDHLNGSIIRRVTLSDDKAKNLQPLEGIEPDRYPIRSVLVKKDNADDAAGVSMSDLSSQVIAA